MRKFVLYFLSTSAYMFIGIVQVLFLNAFVTTSLLH